MRRNVSGQSVTFAGISRLDGTPVATGTWAVYVTKDGGTQAAGAGTFEHEGNGQWTYKPTQGETDAASVGFLFAHDGDGIAVNVHAYPVSYDPTDSVRLGLTSLPNATFDSLSGLPSRTRVQSVPGDTWNLNAASYNTGGTIGQLVNRLDAAITTRATDAGVWANSTRELSAGTNIVLAKGTGITGFNDLDAAGVRAAVGMASADLDTQLDAIAASVSGMTSPWDELTADHVIEGSYGRIFRGYDGICGAGSTTTTIVLGDDRPSGDVSGGGLRFVGGPCAGQSRRILSYDPGTGEAVVDEPFSEAPPGGSKWVLTDRPPGGPVESVTEPVVSSEVESPVVALRVLEPLSITGGVTLLDGSIRSSTFLVEMPTQLSDGLLERLTILISSLAPIGDGYTLQPRDGNGTRYVFLPSASGGGEIGFAVESTEEYERIAGVG